MMPVKGGERGMHRPVGHGDQLTVMSVCTSEAQPQVLYDTATPAYADAIMRLNSGHLNDYTGKYYFM